MPLHNHFRPPVSTRQQWNSFHGMWPAMIVRQLFDILPPGYEASPGVRLGALYEIDVSAHELDPPFGPDPGGGGTATATAPEPTLTLAADLAEQDEFEVRVYDAERRRELVAAIEIVSPGNKDRPESRRAIVGKCTALLREGVCVSVVDLVTEGDFNLCAELLEQVGGNGPPLGPDPPPLCAATLRPRKRHGRRAALDLWHYPLAVGLPLPTLPLWLAPDRSVLLPLEPGYEETCRLLHIP